MRALVEKKLSRVIQYFTAFAVCWMFTACGISCVFAQENVPEPGAGRVVETARTSRNPFVRADSVLAPAADPVCYAVSQDEKVVVRVYVSPASEGLSEREQGCAGFYGVRSPDKIAAYERILEKEKRLRDKMINEINSLMKERNELETETAKQEAFVMELQNKRDEVKKVLRLLEERRN